MATPPSGNSPGASSGGPNQIDLGNPNLPGTVSAPQFIGPGYYDAWRNYTQYANPGLSGRELTEATREYMAYAESIGYATRPTGQTNDGGDGGDGGDDTTTEPFEPPPGDANPFSAAELLENTIFAATGISGLGPWAATLYNQGASPIEIVQALRYGTDKSEAGQRAYQQYLAAFPMMDQFLRDGIFAGESPELQYIEYRNTVKDAAQRYGINENLVSNDKIAQYISNRNSAVEIVDRMGMAATAVATTPAETIGILRDYYGVNSGDLISFYLNPEETEAMLTKRYTAARLGTEAARQKFGIERTEAERLAERGVSIAEAEQGFAQAATQASLMQGFGETATRGDILGAAFGEQEAASKVARIAGSRMGRFQEGGGFASGERGVGGLGTSTTR